MCRGGEVFEKREVERTFERTERRKSARGFFDDLGKRG